MSRKLLPDGRLVKDDEYNRLWDFFLYLASAIQTTPPDPVGDHHRKLAAESLRPAKPARTPRG